MLKEGQIKIIHIPKFENRKIDFYEYLKRYNEWNEKFSSADDNINSNLYIDLNELLYRTRTSFITPGFHLNKYIDSLVKYNVYDINREDPIKKRQFIDQCNIFVNSILISFKTLLDRLAPIVSFFYPGISLNLTFGGKSKW